MKRFLGSVAAVCIVCAISACNDGPSAVDGGTGGGAGQRDSGSGGGTGGGSGSADAGPSLKQAQISLLRIPFDGGGLHGQDQVSSVQVEAIEYSESLFGYLNGRCTRLATSGSCYVANCDERRSDAGTSVAKSIGTLTITGSSVTGGATAAGDRTTFFSEGLWSAPGQVLTISSAGSDVPAFSGKTIKAPDDVIVTSPVCTFDTGSGLTNCGTFSRTAPVNLAWSSGANGLFTIAIGDLFNGGKGPIISCTFAEGVHSGTIDVSLMSHMNPGTAFLLWGNGSSNAFRVGDYDVSLEAGYAQLLGGRDSSNDTSLRSRLGRQIGPRTTGSDIIPTEQP